MDDHQHPFILSPATPRFPPSSHRRNISRSPNRNNRVSVTDDIFNDFSPTRILDAFINPTGRLKASIEAASQPDRAFGIRAARASKNIQEWVRELEEWEWPTGGGSLGFEVPVGKRRKFSNEGQVLQNGEREVAEKPEYIGSLPTPTILNYESRVDQIHTELDGLHMEEIKRHVLDTHFAPSRPSSSSSNASSSVFSFHTKMEDFTAIVTATVLKALPNLSRLMHLMDIWNTRLVVLRRVPRLLRRLEEGERALKSGWLAIRLPITLDQDTAGEGELSRESLEIMRNVLQDKVTRSGQDLDFMLDTLEGREDVLPDAWLDRMEAIEYDYGEWVVAGDKKVRESEWAKMAKIRKKREEEARRIAREAARLKAEEDAKAADEEARRLEAERRSQEAEAARLKADDTRRAIAEAERLRLEKMAQAEAAELARRKREELETVRLREEATQRLQAEALKLAEETKAQEEAAKLRVHQEAVDAEIAKKKADELEAIRLHEERDFQESARQNAKEVEASRLKLESETQDAVRIDQEHQMPENAEASSIREQKEARQPTIVIASIENHRNQMIESTELREEDKVREAALEAEFADHQPRDIITEPQAEAKVLKQESFKLEDVQAKAKVTIAKALTGEAERAQPTRERKLAEPKARDVGIASQEAILARQADALRPEQIITVEAASAKLHANEASEAETLAGQRRQDQESGNVKIERLREEKEALKTAGPTTATNDTKVAEDKGFERFKALRDLEAEIARLKALKAAEDESAQVARLRVFLQTTRTVDSAPNDNLETQESHSPVRRSSPSFSDSSLTGVAAHLVPQNLNSGNSDCDICDNQLVLAETNYTTFDGSNDVYSEPFASYESQSNAPKEPVESAMKSIEDWAVSPSRTADHPEEQSVVGSPGISTPPLIKDAVLDESESSRSKGGPRFQIKQQPAFNAKRSTFGDFYNQDANMPSTEDGSMSESHSKGQYHSPLFTGYSTSDATPEVSDAEAASYFRPVVSPVKSTRSSSVYSEPNTPTSSFGFSDMTTTSQISPTFGKPGIPKKSPRRPAVLQEPPSSPTRMPLRQEVRSIGSTDGSVESMPAKDMDIELVDYQPHSLARKTSITRFNSPSPISISRRDSVSSTGSTVVNGQFGDTPSSPMRGTTSPLRPSTPTSPRNMGSFKEDEISPSIRRHRNGNSHDYTSPDSPPPIPHLLNRSPISHKRNESFSSVSVESTSPNKSSSNVNSPLAPIMSPRKATTDDQMQQQISTLLESIPARIRLTTELNSSPAETLNVKKTRRSIASDMRSSSSMSNYSRAPTPSFTLAPAQGPPRQRSQNGNPEIKVYHLSRSTGEAPIKLFVRLVGENGERVMVRVGGGWADLGEYLKEYASHHGRRATIVDDAKVEIQDLPPRIVSNGSSAAGLRASGRSSPTSRPSSALGLNRPSSALGRPMSSLAVRKTRKSAGDSLDLPSSSNTFRSPSTPIMTSTLSRTAISYETPPSNPPSAERSSSRLSWTEEEPGLGLAGPKSKRVAISEKDQEWVDSMKEKVRQASAEKERMRDREKSLGEMDKVGGTKRLFRKGL